MPDAFDRAVRRVFASRGASGLRASQSLAIKNPFLVGPLIERLWPVEEDGIRVQVRRPDDHLVFDLLFDNLRVQPAAVGGGAELVRDDPGRRAVLIVELPPQAFGEEAFLDAKSPLDGTGKNELPLTRNGQPVFQGATAAKQVADLKNAPESLNLPARVRMSGCSRLAFRMPEAVTALPFSLPAVLGAMGEWPMHLDVGARVDQALDPVWLTDNIASTLNAAIAGTFAPAEAPAVLRELEASAARIADYAASGIGTGATAHAAGDALRAEAAQIFDRRPQLREVPLEAATLSALAAGSAGRLAAIGSAAGVELDARDRDALPYLLLLAGMPHPPAAAATAIEVPYRLLLTPIGTPVWRHAGEAATSQGRTELWHTRLEDSATGGRGPAGRFRFLWSPDVGRSDKHTFRTSLDRQDRDFLVGLTADWTKRQPGGTPYLPKSAEARRLHLSSLGALFDAGGDWEPRPDKIDLEQWRHRSTLGREHYVRVLYAGFLLPFGMAASLVNVTERRFCPLPAGGRSAVLRQRFFVILREHVRRYDRDTFPFSEVEILTEVTPPLGDPATPASALAAVAGDPIVGGSVAGVDVTARMAFWPVVGSGNGAVPFAFQVAATDRDGHCVAFSMPMLFVSEIVNRHLDVAVRAAYNATGTSSRREATMGGVPLRFDAKPGESRLPAGRMRFKAGSVSFPGPLHVRFHPEMEEVVVRVPEIDSLLGRRIDVAMRYPIGDDEVGNAGDVFLLATGNPLDLSFGGGKEAQTDGLGGLGAPAMQIFGLSKRSGPVAGQPGPDPKAALAKALKNEFDPKDFFPADAKLIGGISLGEIVSAVDKAPLDGPTAPRMLSQTFGDRVEASFYWKTEITDPDGAKLIIPRADGAHPTPFVLSGKVIQFLDARPPAREAKASLENFKLNLFGCIILWFDRLAFESLPGRKPDVAVRLHPGEDAVRFGGELEFLNDLRRAIPSNGLADGASLNVTPSGISAGFSLGLPAIEVGIFALSNVTLSASLSLPFDNRPVSLRFAFSERQSPFSLTVSLLGGGGFFAIAIGAAGVQEIEAALEFGAAVSLDLVVASGNVEIKAGVYFHWKQSGDGAPKVEIAGYVRIHGELTIGAIFSASLTFNLQIAYTKDANAAIIWGEAELVVEVEVLLVSFDVAVRCRREFAGGAADPRFLDLIPDQSTWDAYCDAFAQEAA